MATEDETTRQRRGFWLRMARETAPRPDGGRGYSQRDAVAGIGLSPKSASSIVDWEQGTRSPSTDVLVRLARLYDVPTSMFVEPEKTAHERVDELRRGVNEEGDDEAAALYPDIATMVLENYAAKMNEVFDSLGEMSRVLPDEIIQRAMPDYASLVHSMNRVWESKRLNAIDAATKSDDEAAVEQYKEASDSIRRAFSDALGQPAPDRR